MNALEFSIPFNNDQGTLAELLLLKSQFDNTIREIYLAGPQEYSGSGRIMPNIEMEQFHDIVDMIHESSIRVNLVINSTCEGEDWYNSASVESTIRYIGIAHQQYGVEAVTVANPFYITEIRKNFPNIEICASVLADIDTVEKALFYNKAGANVITPDVNINRNIQVLLDMRNFTNAEIKLMVNEGCLYNCPFRKFHFNYISHKSKKPDIETITRGEKNTFSFNCMQISQCDQSQILKSCWIRPEDLRKYRDITKYFKIVGRTSSKRMITRATKAYLGEQWDGDLLELMAGNLYSYSMSRSGYLDNKALGDCDFFEQVTNCNHDCIRCSFCTTLANNNIKTGVMTVAKLEEMGFEIIK